MRRAILAAVSIWFLAQSATAGNESPLSVETATLALRRGVEFFRTQVAVEGGYLWRYAADFSEREGEVPASATTAWVQPPGTPTVGMAYLTAYQLTGEQDCLDAATETGLALVRGQLASGGWDYRIEFAPQDRMKYAYHVDLDGPPDDSQRNVSTLDDNTTQAALSFLMRLDHTLKFKDARVHEAAVYALRSLLGAQYPNGAWPQRFSGPPNPEDFPVKAASYPENWSRTHPAVDYRTYYTFNDNAIADMIELMFLAAEIYEEPKYAEAGKRAGEFTLLAQMPEPQPGWAQQYNAQMQPAWARKFEPPAVTGSESQGVMRTLLRLFEITGERRFLEPLPRALAYFRRSQLDDGRLARFYELETNRPLYFTKKYQLTYDDADLPTHYGFKSGNGLDGIEAEYQRLASLEGGAFSQSFVFEKVQRPEYSEKLANRAARVVAAQDAQGAWIGPALRRERSKISKGTPVIRSVTFCENLGALARFIAASER